MKYYSFTIENLEPLKMGKQMSTDLAEFSLDYITGTAIRGAVISKLINAGYDLDDKVKKSNLFSNVFFLNAYPVVGDNRTVPAPVCYMANKRALAGYNGRRISVHSSFERREADSKIVKKEPFILFDKNIIKGVNVKKQFNLHISVNGRNDTTDVQKGMFRYEAIAKSQLFKAYIGITDEDEGIIDKIKEVICENTVMYLGGSKGSGYGKCKITQELAEVNENPEIMKDIEYMGQEEMYVYFLSDAILRDKYGNSTGVISELLDLGFEYCSGALDTVITSGYNNTWKVNLPQERCIKAGSIQKYVIKHTYSGEDQKILINLGNHGVGERCEEGYGRVIFISHPHIDYWEKSNRYPEERTCEKSVDLKTKKQLNNILFEMVKNYIYNNLGELIINESSNLDEKNIKVSSSQIGKIIDILDDNSEPLVLKKNINDYFNHMKEKKNNLTAIRSFNDTKINGIGLDEYIINLITYMDKKIIPDVESKFGMSLDFDTEKIIKINYLFIKMLLVFLRKKCRK